MLLRFDPFRDFDRVAELPTRWLPTSMLALDAYRQGQEYVIQLDLPGADPASIDLSVDQNVLTVRSERRAASRAEGDRVVVTERRYGTFTRQLVLGDHLDTEHIRAAYDNGVLTVTIPVAEKAKARRIEIETVTPAVAPPEAGDTPVAA